MLKKTIFKVLDDRDYGEAILIISKINHYRGDLHKTSYTATIPADNEVGEVTINKRYLSTLLRHLPAALTKTK